ncbi:AraC family transcriptional regulator [Bacillus mesophilum]|uniref:AraC family transcriptional regulator n=1 Tax=Bacillus mesophilum TaxID=1071718 RepID=UPI0013761D01|nr:AraC family transcriptional regulator [Bacillus mesophilum]
MKTLLLDDLEYITNLYYDLFKVPLLIFDPQGTLLYQVPNHNIESPFYVPIKHQLLEVYRNNDQPSMPMFFQSPYLENYFSVSLHSNGVYIGFLLVGPVLNKKLSEEAITIIRNDYYPKTKKEEFLTYYHSLPVIKEIDFIHISCALYYMIYQKKLDVSDIYEKKYLEENKQGKIEEPIAQIAEKRQNDQASVNTLDEKKLFSLIKAGKTNQVLHALHTQSDMEIGLLSKKSYLRSLKNSGIAAITLATRAAVDGGLNEITAYNLSDSLIQQLEDLNDHKSVGEFIQKCLLKFAELVENKKKNKYSKPVSACQSYINSHLYREISLSELANTAGLNASYLSVLFKKEVGISISEFIHREKVEEAKNLMRFTNHSISEIATILNFHDQSHFSKVFKKITGITPKQFYIKKLDKGIDS